MSDSTQQWTCTRSQLEDALSRIAIDDVKVVNGVLELSAESMADVILLQLSQLPARSVTVHEAGLVAVLADAEGFIGGKDNAPFARLAAAAGVS